MSYKVRDTCSGLLGYSFMQNISSSFMLLSLCMWNSLISSDQSSIQIWRIKWASQSIVGFFFVCLGFWGFFLTTEIISALIWMYV